MVLGKFYLLLKDQKGTHFGEIKKKESSWDFTERITQLVLGKNLKKSLIPLTSAGNRTHNLSIEHTPITTYNHHTSMLRAITSSAATLIVQHCFL